MRLKYVAFLPITTRPRGSSGKCGVSSLRFARLPSSGGMPPVRSFECRVTLSRLVRLPSSGGMTPLSRPRLSLGRFSCSTRGGEPPITTPSQSAIGTAALQFRMASPASGSRILRSVSQSCTSPGFFSGSGTTYPAEQAAMSPDTSRQSECSATRRSWSPLIPNPPKDGV